MSDPQPQGAELVALAEKCDMYARSQITWGELREWVTSTLAAALRSPGPQAASQGVEDERGERLWAETLHAAQPRHHEIREAARSAGAFMHRDGCIYFTNTHQLHCAILALASPPAPALASEAEPCEACGGIAGHWLPECRAASDSQVPSLTEADLPPYPDAHVMRWSDCEKRALLAWGNSLRIPAPPPAGVLEGELALKGRAAIMQAWNNLDHSTRMMPSLDVLYRAIVACEDVVQPFLLVGTIHHYTAQIHPRVEWFRRPGNVGTNLYVNKDQL